jgi:hypothetical protein
MSKRPTKQTLHTWAIYRIAKKQLLLGYVHDQPDEASAIEAAIDEFEIPAAVRGRLIAQPRIEAIGGRAPMRVRAGILLSVQLCVAADPRREAADGWWSLWGEKVKAELKRLPQAGRSAFRDALLRLGASACARFKRGVLQP